MWMFIGILGFLSAVVFLILGLVARIRKQSTTKKYFIIAGLSLIIMILGVANDDSTTTEVADPVSTETAVPTTAPTAEVTSESTQVKDADQVPLSKDDVLAYAANLTGGTFIQKVDVGTDNIRVEYFSNFKEFQDAKPNSNITKERYEDYFSTGDKINKLLMEETSRLFKQFPGAASIDMIVPFAGKTYSVALTKGEVESFYNVDFSTLTSNEIWREKISDPHFKKADRQKFADAFVKVN
ncbi:hypothetical protein [Paenibacillus sp. NPDC057934]|uniref:hypothetical protein n=1 Tax=Paenibacillus sp. NPDC057934 TaxID=3346282 RepID=UPI0036D7B94C